jgi:type VI protein secretion system component VasK
MAQSVHFATVHRVGNKSLIVFFQMPGYITGTTLVWTKKVASKSQREATSAHRRRAAARGLVRLEVQALRKDVELVRTVVETLRGEPEKAKALRSALEKALVNPAEMTAFDIFGSDLPDEAFAGVFDQPRERDWRKLKL